MMTSPERKVIENGKNELNNSEEIAQVADFPKEIKILGKISRVYIEGNDLYQKLVFEEIDPSLKNPKTEGKQYVIVPIKDENSVVQFIKVPIYKLRKKPKAKNVGVVSCEKINPAGVEPLTEGLDKWSTDKNQIGEMEKIELSCGPYTRGLYPVYPVYPVYTAHEAPKPTSIPATTPQPVTPHPATPPAASAPVKQQNPPAEEETEPFRLLSHLITVKDKKSKRRAPRKNSIVPPQD